MRNYGKTIKNLRKPSVLLRQRKEHLSSQFRGIRRNYAYLPRMIFWVRWVAKNEKRKLKGDIFPLNRI